MFKVEITFLRDRDLIIYWKSQIGSLISNKAALYSGVNISFLLLS